MTITLNTYSHLIPEDENKAVDLLNNIERIYNQENFEIIIKIENKKPL